jgi:hypothetical protein
MGSRDRTARDPLRDSLRAGAAALLFGLALHALTVWARDQGPTWGTTSLRGNGAIVLLLLAPVALVLGELWCLRRRAWLGAALVPIGLFAGLFLLAGPI